jgi:myo-inositol-1(or 4)-monophosphatase
MDKCLSILADAVREAGLAIAEMRKQGVTVSRKINNDVLTHADLCANQILKARLSDAYPEYGWLSEESIDDAVRLQSRLVWVVDPIDGTREYVEGVPEYAVSAALVECGTPILACVFNPETDELFTAQQGAGVFLNGRRVQCKQSSQERLVLLASRSECNRGEWERFSHEMVQPVGSIAYKLALVAAGFADATFSLSPKSEWDIAAGVLLVTEAGGVVTDKARLPFAFNQANVIVNGIIASSFHAARRVMAVITG